MIYKVTQIRFATWTNTFWNLYKYNAVRNSKEVTGGVRDSGGQSRLTDK